MGTVIQAGDDASVLRAAHALDEGALVVYPCGGRYALGADALDEDAVERVFAAKRRPPDLALSVAVSTLDDARHVAHVTPLARRLGAELLPGPLTLALRARPTAPDLLVAGGELVWVRVPSEGFARELARHHGPVTATNAAIAGAPDARRLSEARDALGSKARYYVDAGDLAGMRATVVDATGDAPRVLVEGDVPAARLAAAREAS